MALESTAEESFLVMSTPLPALVKSIMKDKSVVKRALFRKEDPYTKSFIFDEYKYEYIEGNQYFLTWLGIDFPNTSVRSKRMKLSI